MLDPDDRDALTVQVFDRLNEGLDLRLREPAGDLVQEQDAGIAGQRSSQLQALTVEQ